MDNIDDDWENFLQCENILDNTDNEKAINYVNNLQRTNVNEIPKSSELYISTKTKISYLNKNNIDIKDIFWKIPILDYSSPKNGIIKKQIKYSSTDKCDVEYITEQLKIVKYFEEQIIEHIDNPEGRIKYKDQRKISVGISKKDILSYRSKKKRAFFNCFVIIMRLWDNNEFKEMHVKVFNTGKLEIPGIQNDLLLDKVLCLLVNTLRPYLGDDLMYELHKSETVLINSNFNCGYFIDRDKLYDVLKYKYRINSNFDACSYPGIQCKFYYDKLIKDDIAGIDNQSGQQPNHKNFDEISFMIFRTGSVLIVGKCEEPILYNIYIFIKNILKNEYENIHSTNEQTILSTNKQRKKKIRKKIIFMD